jgi:Ankyrin repeats (3 copies)
MGDRRPLGSRFQDCCRQTREGGGLPEGSIIPAGITHDLVLFIDPPARRMEREERLLTMHGGDLDWTMRDICFDGGGKDARFLLAHGADPNRVFDGWYVLSRAAHYGHVAVVEALLEADAGLRGLALSWAGQAGHTAVVALLLEHGADVSYHNDNVLWYAAHDGHYLELAWPLCFWTGGPLQGIVTWLSHWSGDITQLRTSFESISTSCWRKQSQALRARRRRCETARDAGARTPCPVLRSAC